jgi:hypothetical protein
VINLIGGALACVVLALLVGSALNDITATKKAVERIEKLLKDKQ